VLDEHLKLSNEWENEEEMWRNFSENLRRTYSEDASVGVRGADSYLIESGKILAQTIHYTTEEKHS
jgi:L-lactate utilization protein LutB